VSAPRVEEEPVVAAAATCGDERESEREDGE